MKLTIADVKKTAKLANLPISDEEAEKYTEQLGEVIGYVEQLEDVNTDNVPPTFQVIDNAVNVMRKDKVEKSLSQNEALSNAREKYQGFFVAKGVFSE